MGERKEKNFLNIYLIKSNVKDFNQVVKETSYLKHYEIQDIGEVYYEESSKYNPSWIKVFFHDIKVLKDNIFNSGAKVLLLTKIVDENNNNRTFAIPFGYGHTLFKEGVIEDRFGLITALNIIEKNSIKAIKKNSIGKYYKSSTEQMPKQSEISEFGFDVYSEIMYGITGRSSLTTFIEGNVSGSKSFSCTAPVDITNINEFLTTLYKEYIKDTYKEKDFGWIDQIKKVVDKSLINSLDIQLIESIKNNENKFWMAVPEVIIWEKIKGFIIQGDTNLYNDILIENVIKSFRMDLKSVEQLKNKKIRVINAQNEEEMGRWNSYKCLYGEIDFDNKSYCINNGNWFEVDSNFVNQVNEEYKTIEISDIEFLDNEGLNEPEYNIKFAESNKDYYLCLDGNNITYGGGHSKIEICDILTKDGKLIHIKQYGGSSVLSHLFNQAAVSIELIKQDNEFVKKANSLISDNDFKLVPGQTYDVVFGIISKDDNELPNIPFFSKITFNNTVRRLKSFGVSPSIKRIKSIL